jgi:hypothetical protein
MWREKELATSVMSKQHSRPVVSMGTADDRRELPHQRYGV